MPEKKINLTFTLKISESLLSILRDMGCPKPENSSIRVVTGTPVRQVLLAQGISPLLVPMIFLDNRKISVDTPLEADGVLTLHGPLAGG